MEIQGEKASQSSIVTHILDFLIEWNATNILESNSSGWGGLYEF